MAKSAKVRIRITSKLISTILAWANYEHLDLLDEAGLRQSIEESAIDMVAFFTGRPWFDDGPHPIALLQVDSGKSSGGLRFTGSIKREADGWAVGTSDEFGVRDEDYSITREADIAEMTSQMVDEIIGVQS
jgi:hypothetical protein